MARIIKASNARMAEPEAGKALEKEKKPKSTATLEALGLAVGDTEQLTPEEIDAKVEAMIHEKSERDAKQEQQEKEDYQAAYDELLQAAQDEVELLLADARKEAATILKETEAHANTVRDQAWEAGYSQALAQGRKDCTSTLQKAQKEIDNTLAKLPVEREKMLKKLEGQMLDIAMEVAGKILHMELDRNDQAYLSMLKDAIARMPAEDSVIIRLHPDEYERFFKSKESTFSTPNGNVRAKMVSDPSMNPYDVVIESPSGVVDAGADQQLQRMRDNMNVQ